MFKFDRLRDKSGRYSSHYLFFIRFIAEHVILNVLKLELEPTLGNQ